MMQWKFKSEKDAKEKVVQRNISYLADGGQKEWNEDEM